MTPKERRDNSQPFPDEYLSGPKYCDCYVEENHIFDDPSSSSLEKNLEDCRSLLTVMYIVAK